MALASLTLLQLRILIMNLFRFTIGIQLNKKMFRLPSIGGLVVDEILNGVESNKHLGVGYYTQVSTTTTGSGDYSLSLIDDENKHSLTILSDQFIFKKSSQSAKAAVNVDSAIEEFKVMWKIVNKVVSFPEVRRIGMVGEFRQGEKSKGKGSVELVEKLTKFQPPESSNRFHLTFEERELTSEGGIADTKFDDFINTIYSFYIGSMDETPASDTIHSNIDVQRYFNPAKLDPIKELQKVKSLYVEKKAAFKDQIKNLGLE
jgi:hypothetical protein